jgi:CPA2 family monovalent cation:H+ antiporter-2
VLERFLRRMPGFWRKLEANRPLPPLPDEHMHDHVVIVGYGRVGKHLVNVLESLNVPLLVIESDLDEIDRLNDCNIATLYGDAANSEVLTHASLATARVMVSTTPDETTTALIVANARDLAPNLPNEARSATVEGVGELARLGADHIVQPELEGGLELVHHTLLRLGFPLRQVHQYAEAFRRDNYNIENITTEEHRSLHDLLMATEGIEIKWMVLAADSPLVGQTLAEANIRSITGASVAAIMRNKHLIPNPKSATVFEAGDRIGVIGEEEQIEAAQHMVNGQQSAAVEPQVEPPL